MNQTHGLSSEHRLEEANALPEEHAAEGSTNADEGSPEHDASEVFVTQENETQPCE
jgi:hypothetical protein